MTNKSKTKGKTWERDVVLFLSELYNQSFIRVPNSGAYVGGKNEYRKAYLSEEQIKLMRGDIVPPLHYPNFLAECKNYEQFPFHLLGHNGSAHIHRVRDRTPLNPISIVPKVSNSGYLDCAKI